MDNISELIRAAKAALAAADARASSKHPLAYVCPWRELTELRMAVEKVESTERERTT